MRGSPSRRSPSTPSRRAGTSTPRPSAPSGRVVVSALPEAGLADKRIIGARAAVRLEAGTVLTTSMTSAALAADLDPTERIVQVPVGIGAELAVPGARVDIVGESPRLSSPALEPGGEPEGLVLCSRARVILAQQEQKGPE